MNANEIIKGALRDLVVLPSGGTPTTNQYTDGLEALNELISSWSANLNLVYEDTREELSITSGTQSFTIGASGDQTSARPLKIVSASLKSGNNEYPMDEISEARYQSIFDKTISSQPYRFYYRNTFPNGTFYFESTTDASYTLILTSIKQLTQFADGTTDYDLPEHYKRALRKNLAVEIAPEIGAANRITPLLVNQAQESKDAILGLAVDIEPSVINIRSGRYNIEADA